MIYSNERGSVIDAHSEYLQELVFRPFYFRMINYKLFNGKINNEANKREDDYNKLRNLNEDIKLLDKLYV